MKKQPHESLAYALKLLAKSSFIVLLGVFSSKLFTFLYKFIVARNFGKETYGLFSLSVIIMSIGIMLATLGIQEGISRYIPLYRGKHEMRKISYLLRNSLFTLALSGILVGILLFFLKTIIATRLYHEPLLIPYLSAFSFLIPLTVILYVLLATFRGFEKIGWYSFFNNIVQNFTRLALLIIFIILGWSNAIILSYVLATCVTLVLAYVVLRRVIPDIFVRPLLTQEVRSTIRREIFTYSWPLMFFGIIAYVFTWTDSLIIAYYKGVGEVGLYNAAVPLATLLLFIPDIFVQLFFPLITRHYAHKEHDLIKELSKQVEKWIFALNVPIFLIALIFPGAFIKLFFGSEFLVAASALRMLAIGNLFISLIIVPSSLLAMVGKSKVILTNMIILGIVNIVLNLLLVPKYGLNGAAFATMVSSILLSILYFIQVQRYLSFVPLRKKMLMIALAPLLPFLILLAVKNFFSITAPIVLLLGSFFVLLYFMCILLFKALDKNDLLIITTIKNKFLNSSSFTRSKN